LSKSRRVAAQERIFTPNLDRESAWSSRHIQHALVGGEIEALRNFLSDGEAEGIHELAKSAQAYWVLVQGGEGFFSRSAKRLLPGRAELPERIEQELPLCEAKGCPTLRAVQVGRQTVT
jgi:hypothetical protein